MNLSQRQNYALEHPCENPFMIKSLDANYKQIVHLGNLRLSTLLSVESVGKHLQWHASVAILSLQNAPIHPFGNITKEENERVMGYLMKMLEDVGTGRLSTILPKPIYHMFKDLTAAEASKINKYSVVRN